MELIKEMKATPSWKRKKSGREDFPELSAGADNAGEVPYVVWYTRSEDASLSLDQITPSDFLPDIHNGR
jgi:hypothetical protein